MEIEQANMTSAPNHQIAVRRRKIAYRACHRGMKEMDVLLGGYVTANIDTMDEADLDELERIIALADADLLNWAIGRAPVPDEHRSELLDSILAHSVRPEDYTRA